MKNKGLPAIPKLAILTTITVIAWIVFEAYRSATLSPPPSVPPEILSPLDPTLDEQSLSEIQRRIQIEDFEIDQTTLLDQNPLVEIEEEITEDTFLEEDVIEDAIIDETITTPDV